MKRLLLIFGLIILVSVLKSQVQCTYSLTFCTGNTYNDTTFIAGTSTGAGISYGCISSAYRSRFLISQAQNSGSVTIKATGSSNLDIISWGPYESTNELCTMPLNNILACSSTPSLTDSISFNITKGKYYIIGVTTNTMVTSSFTLSQSSGNGILCYNACSKSLPSSSICYVSPDTLMNQVVYINSVNSSFYKGAILYRQNVSSTYDSVAYIPNGQPDKFVDTITNANQQSYQYKIVYIDSCDNRNKISTTAHRSIFLQSSLGTGNQVNLSWVTYAGIAYTTQYIYRGTSLANMQLINTVSNSTTAYTDLNPPPGLNYYRIAIPTPTNCTNNALTGDTLIMSNYRTNQYVGINELEIQSSIIVSPNPAKDIVKINSVLIPTLITITDITGKSVLKVTPNSKEVTIPIENLSAGVYLINLSINNNSYFKKLVVQ